MLIQQKTRIKLMINGKKEKFLRHIITILILSVILLSSIYIVKEANHHCEKDNCSICDNIFCCINIITNEAGGTLNAESTFPIFLLMILAGALSIKSVKLRPLSLLSRGIRLNE